MYRTVKAGPRALRSQLGEQLGFALGGEAGAELGLALGGLGAEPREGVGRGERQGAMGEARGDGAADVTAVKAEGSALARYPHRHVAPSRDIVRLQEGGRRPDNLGIDV